MAYEIAYSPEAVDHLGKLARTDQVMILDEVDEQLSHEPMLATRKRKVLRPNPIAPWELRLGNIRVFYDVQDAPNQLVTIKAVGVKQHNDLWIGGERIAL